MVSGASINRAFRVRVLAICCIMVAIGLTAALIAAQLAGNAVDRELTAGARETLEVQAQSLDGLMEKFRILPNLIGRHPVITEAFATNSDDAIVEAGNLIKNITAATGAANILLYDTEGKVIVAANDHADNDLSIRAELIASALQGRLGRGVRLLGPREAAYAFTYAARDANGAMVGIVGVLTDLDRLLQAWALSTNPVYVMDDGRRLLVTNHEEWRMLRQFEISIGDGRIRTYEMAGDDVEMIDVYRDLPQLGWQLHVLAPTAPVARVRALAATAAVLVTAMITLGLIYLTDRQRNAIRRERRDRATAIRLERVVRDRTGELTAANKTLGEEVQHRKKTEAQLRKTQNELVQTGKLAALGQMSTALAHEFNQPLAATKSYADNALTLIDRNRTEEARENIGLISQMADRMAEISSHLRNFARKPNTTLGPVPLEQVVNDSLAVLSATLRSTGTSVDVTSDLDDLTVIGGRVRLQQVLVNLLSNAIDAQKDMSDQPQIEISAERSGKSVLIHVRDFGPGITGKDMDQIFDPFFTTKPPGAGLGLGLSISYNIIKDFKGDLIVNNHSDGGARFTIRLPAARTARKAAE